MPEPGAGQTSVTGRTARGRSSRTTIASGHPTIHGYSVREAAGVRAAIEALAEEKPDLLLLDIGLPDGTGRDLLRRAELPGDLSALAATVAPVSTAQLPEFHPSGYPAETVRSQYAHASHQG
jgi:CheY-like chemotaxis protein